MYDAVVDIQEEKNDVSFDFMYFQYYISKIIHARASFFADNLALGLPRSKINIAFFVSWVMSRLSMLHGKLFCKSCIDGNITVF